MTSLNSKIMQEMQESKEEIADLEARSRKLSELVVEEKFTVEQVIGESYATNVTFYHSGIPFGTSIPSYETGFTLKQILTVLPYNQIPVRTLIFNGISPVKAGDYISAKIPVCERKEISGVGPLDSNRVFYFDRNFTTEESAIELSILAPDGTVLRTDRSVDYKRFVKEWLLFLI